MIEDVSFISETRLRGVIAMPFSSSSVAEAASDVSGGVASSACWRLTGRLDGR